MSSGTDADKGAYVLACTILYSVDGLEVVFDDLQQYPGRHLVPVLWEVQMEMCYW